ncbi:hypothetical protein [Phreatobacter sp.]|uniref:hypothetical protein n=1 Tax=Phreatobacter sp. TaxID=1966341 RepID=UPI003F716707
MTVVSELVMAAQERGTLPRLSDPVAQAAFHAILDPRLVAPGRTFAKDELDALSPLCVKAGQIVFDYLTFRSRGHPDLAKPGNALLYQPEIATGVEFWLRCDAVLMAGIAGIVRQMPPEQMNDGVNVDFQDLRQSAFRNLSAVLHMVREGYLRGGSVGRLAVALCESAPRFIAAFPAEEREEIAGVVRQTLPYAGTSASADFEAFVTVLTAP